MEAYQGLHLVSSQARHRCGLWCGGYLHVQRNELFQITALQVAHVQLVEETSFRGKEGPQHVHILAGDGLADRPGLVQVLRQ